MKPSRVQITRAMYALKRAQHRVSEARLLAPLGPLSDAHQELIDECGRARTQAELDLYALIE